MRKPRIPSLEATDQINPMSKQEDECGNSEETLILICEEQQNLRKVEYEGYDDVKAVKHRQNKNDGYQGIQNQCSGYHAV